MNVFSWVNLLCFKGYIVKVASFTSRDTTVRPMRSKQYHTLMNIFYCLYLTISRNTLIWFLYNAHQLLQQWRGLNNGRILFYLSLRYKSHIELKMFKDKIIRTHFYYDLISFDFYCYGTVC